MTDDFHLASVEGRSTGEPEARSFSLATHRIGGRVAAEPLPVEAIPERAQLDVSFPHRRHQRGSSVREGIHPERDGARGTVNRD